MKTSFRKLIDLLMVLSISISTWMVGGLPATVAAQSSDVSFTILHTNDFHGQLEPSGSNPGIARVATIVNGVRSSVGAENVLLLDAGDEMQGSLLSNLQKGQPTIALFNALGYGAATFGNHEFDWKQEVLIERTSQATYPFVTANIVSGNCDATNWTPPSFASPYVIKTVGSAGNQVRVGIIGVTTTETPTITIAEATQGLCFKDPAESILHYYDEIKAQSDVIVVLSHLGYTDGGYGYGIPVYGDQTLAVKLNTAQKPVNLIIGGHSHTNLSTPALVGSTVIGQAYYNGRNVGRANVTVKTDHSVSVTWTSLAVPTSTAEDGNIKSIVTTYTSNPDYQALINQEIGWTNVPIGRYYDGDSLMGYFVNDAIYNNLNNDEIPENDADMVFNNAGGLRADVACVAPPCLLNYGTMFSILPFGNQTIVGDMTGAQILDVLNQSASLSKGALQPAGIRYSFYHYQTDVATLATTYAWGAFDICVINKTSGECEPLDMNRTYRVATNEFLAPSGGDNYNGFKYMTNISYWGDMLNLVNGWVSANYTADHPYDAALDGRIFRDGTNAADSGSIKPITILHNNDSHGNLAKGTYVGFTQLATLIKQERAKNPNRTILLSGGDLIQGDSMMYYFKSAPLGYSADGKPLDESLQTNPMMAVMNALGYDAMTLGNHEFNFGSQIFQGVLGQANFAVLGANVSDDGQYGLAAANGGTGVQPYFEKDVDGIKVAILGITNHRVPNYELPSNIPGLAFSDPIAKTQELTDQLRGQEDVIIALTHIGFTEDPKSVEVDKNVDTNLAAQVSGLDAIIGAHSHTNPAYGYGNYKYLPAYVADPDGKAVIINQAYRYNNTLGEVILGVREKDGGGYEVVSQAGKYLSVQMATAEDSEIKVIVDPYVSALAAYNGTVVGQTTAPIDALQAYTQETTGANLQADAALYELAAKGITDVDFHLSGAMTNKAVAGTATTANPVTLKVSDMFTVMPYENSLVVLSMNGPQLKAVLERAYRNYYYYKYVSGYGGYSYYTTCMIDTNSGGKITYNDLYPNLPDGNNVVSLEFNGQEVDFNDAETYYNVSTVNYLAAGSCNFNDGGTSLWPLSQTVHDTQYYVRDSVIDYITAMGVVSPKVEGRLNFINDTSGPTITFTTPANGSTYLHPEFLTLDFGAEDTPAGVRSIVADLDGTVVDNGQSIDLHTLALGSHTLTVTATDKAGNGSTESVTFTVTATIDSLKTSVNRLYDEGKIDNQDIRDSLLAKLTVSKKRDIKDSVKSFIKLVDTQSGKHIDPEAAILLKTDAEWVLANIH